MRFFRLRNIPAFVYQDLATYSAIYPAFAITGYLACHFRISGRIPDMKKTGIPGTASRLLRSIDDQPEFIRNQYQNYTVSKF